MADAIPVMMYHSVAPRIEGWAFNYLSFDPACFEDHISTLARAGYRSVLLPEVHDHVSGRRALPAKSVALTFDDGYLDNWVFAVPVLKKYGFKATVFVSTDFIDPRDIQRPTAEDAAAGRVRMEGLAYRGFLTVAEMKSMLASGLIDIQGHCKTHTWHFTGPKIVDFHHPGDSYPWLAWNRRPERKYLYLEEDQTEYVPWGSPIYEFQPAVQARCYFPDRAVERAAVAVVEAGGGRRFFDESDWRSELMAAALHAAAGATGGREETSEQRKGRLGQEVVASRAELGSLVGKTIDYLCWPNGAYDQTALGLAEGAGYTAWTLGSRAVTTQKNRPGEDPRWIARMAAAPWWMFRGRRIGVVDGDFMRYLIEDYRGVALSSFRLRWHKLGKLLASYTR
ncbi:MAG: polysaccharide deacetylase family protein [bacterium]